MYLCTYLITYKYSTTSTTQVNYYVVCTIGILYVQIFLQKIMIIKLYTVNR